MPDAPNKQLLENSIRQNFGNDITVSANLKQEIILTTADKAHLLAGEFMKAIEAKHAVDFPLGLFLAMVGGAIFGAIKSYGGAMTKLPIVGNFAEKWA